MYCSCESKKNTARIGESLPKEIEKKEEIRTENRPILFFSIMERRNAATYLFDDNVENNEQIHWLKFNKEEYEPDGHRYILYEFRASNVLEGSHYEFKMISTKGDKILFTSEEKGRYLSGIDYSFEQPMYEIEKQKIVLKIIPPNRKEPAMEFSFDIILDQKVITGYQ
jgi:hypothetical protein